jgi:hypothetical protein
VVDVSFRVPIADQRQSAGANFTPEYDKCMYFNRIARAAVIPASGFVKTFDISGGIYVPRSPHIGARVHRLVVVFPCAM